MIEGNYLILNFRGKRVYGLELYIQYSEFELLWIWFGAVEFVRGTLDSFIHVNKLNNYFRNPLSFVTTQTRLFRL